MTIIKSTLTVNSTKFNNIKIIRGKGLGAYSLTAPEKAKISPNEIK